MSRSNPDHPVHDLVASRWSARSYQSDPIPPAVIRSLFEAARWAPSCFNEQPWSFIVAHREDTAGFALALTGLVEPNQAWARHAAALVFAITSTKFQRNAKPNRHAWHDVGLAVATLSLQATDLGWNVHQMAGIQPEVVRAAYGVPEDHDVVTGIALGRADGDAPADRSRKSQDEFLFAGRFGTAYPG